MKTRSLNSDPRRCGTRFQLVVLALILATLPARAALEFKFNTDPNSEELQALAKPAAVDESLYGCGPLQTPGVTYHVALTGNDKADGRTPGTAWRRLSHALRQLKPGDTLLIDEGEYVEPELELGPKHPLCGEPGRPITIAAAPCRRVEITTSVIPKLTRTPDSRFTWQARLETEKPDMTAWETDTLTELQQLDSLSHVDELPGTFCFVPETRTLHVHFTDSRGADVHSVAVQLGEPSVTYLGRGARGWDVCGSYLHFKGLRFKHQGSAMVIRGESVKTKAADGTESSVGRGGDHITVEDCSFYSTHFAGLVLFDEARFNLIRNCYGVRNGGRGSILINAKTTRDNLIIGNLLENSVPTLREGGWTHYYGICNYGHSTPNRNLVLNNIMDDRLSFRTKFMSPNFLIQGNIMTGSVQVYPVTYYKFAYEPAERVTFRNNVMLGPMTACNHPLGPGGPGANWAGPFKVSINNFAPAPGEKPADAVARAHFADPAYRDYRLQSDSPLLGKAIGGGNIGAFPGATERILYVGPAGNDQAAGTALARAWRTLARAAAALRPGDTLYVLPGIDSEPLKLDANGTAEQRISIRAHDKKDVTLPSLVVRASHVTIEGFQVTGGVRVEGEAVTLRRCLVRDHLTGAGVATGPAAHRLVVEHCTVVGNAVGLKLDPALSDAAVRDSVVAFNREACLADAPDALLVSHTCWHGTGAELQAQPNSWRCVTGDPEFVNREKGDYRLRWDSPAANLAAYGRDAGCREALPRQPVIENVRVVNLRPDSAVVAWETPQDDTVASLRYRAGADGDWQSASSPAKGTVHGAPLSGLRPGAEYTFYINARNASGGAARSEMTTFAAPAAPPPTRNLYVAPAGNDGADGLSPRTAWRTLRKACFEAGAGDTVTVAPGRYAEMLTPFGNGAEGKPLIFRSEKPLEAVLDGGLMRAVFAILPSKRYITVDGFLFERSRPAGGGSGLFQVTSCSNVSFVNCRVGGRKPEGGFEVCFALRDSRDCRIEKNVIWGTRYHVTAHSCPGLLVKNNTFARGQVFSVSFSGSHEGARLVNNLFYFPTSVPNAAVSIDWRGETLQLTSDYNLFGPMVDNTHVAYAHRGNLLDLTLSGETLDVWRKNSGLDAHSIQTWEPCLVDPQRGDFRLRGESPARDAGAGGVSMGACSALRLFIDGKTRLGPGEGRTVRLNAQMHGGIPGGTVFVWRLPGGETRQGQAIEYTLPAGEVSAVLAVNTAAEPGDSIEIPVAACPENLANRKGVVRVEAEDFVAQGGGEVLIYDAHVNASGKSIANWYGSAGHWLEWELAVPADGDYEIAIRYSSNTDGRKRSLEIDGACPGDAYREITFAGTGGWSTDADNWQIKTLGPPIPLTAGKHRLRMTCLDTAINADYILLLPVAKHLALPPQAWRFQAKGNFTGHLDRRGLYQITHPMATSRAGDYGRIETQVTVPADALPPYTLQFYVSDNITGQEHPKWAVVDLRVGHRFKQVLIEDKVIWSEDIAVNTPLTDPRYQLVDITPHVKRGGAFTLALRLWEELDSDKQTPGDLFRPGRFAGTTTEYTPLPRDRYSTFSYWGDVAIHSGSTPDAAKLDCRWTPKLKQSSMGVTPVAPAAREQRTLAIEKAELLRGDWAWPVSQGFPLPQGGLRETANMALFETDGRPVSATFAPLSRWPDGSLRWVLADFALPPESRGNWQLAWGSELKTPPPPPEQPVRTRDDLHADNGLVWAHVERDEAKRPGILTVGRIDGTPIVSGLHGYLDFQDKALRARWTEGQWLSRSPHRAEMQITGELVAANGDRYGSCRLRLTLFSGSPFVRLLYTIVNERTEPVPDDVLDKETIKRTGGLVGDTRSVTAAVASYGLRLSIPGARPAATGTEWASAGTEGGTVTATVRDLEHMPPAGLESNADGIDFQLFKPGDKTTPLYRTYAGEAKTHEIWLAVTEQVPTPKAIASLAQRIDTPPRLDTSAMIRDTYVWGVLPRVDPGNHLPEFAMIIERCLAPFYGNTLSGIREYGSYPGCNFYWNRLHSAYMYYAMTGERKWFDWAERTVRNYMDVWTLNWWPDGSMKGAKIRNMDKFLCVSLLHQYPHPMFDHWNMTGDADALRIGRENSEFVMTHESMVREMSGNSARAQGWPLMVMVRAWQETGDPRYMDYAKRIVDVAVKYMEDRRGAYLQVHGSHSHRGIVPFMTGILCTGLRQYHYWTGDERAAVALVQNAEAMFAEMHDPACSSTTPNIDYYYSPNPYLCGPDGRGLIAHLNPNIVSAQAYAACLMDDPELAAIAWRSWKAYLQTAGWEQNFYDYLYDLHAALYWLDKAPVPDRTPQLTVGRLWRHAVAAPEIWLDRPDDRPVEAQVRWTVYEPPNHRGRPVPTWPRYCKQRALRGEVQLLDSDARPVASAPIDFTAQLYGGTVKLKAGAGKPGLHRIVVRGVEEAPVSLILQDLSEHVQRWGTPVDRGWLTGGNEFYFRIPEQCQEISIEYALLTPWEKISVDLLDSEGRPVKQSESDTGDRWRESSLKWQVPVPAEERGRIWRVRQSPPASAVLRIAGAGPVVSLSPDAVFTPTLAPAPDAVPPPDAPPAWSEPVLHIAAGTPFSVPRGPKTGDHTYQHVHVREGTLEFWLRADTDDSSVANPTFLSFGGLSLWRRTQLGTYYNLGKGFLQSGFLIRPRVWYHLALTWRLGDERHKPEMNLFINGVAMAQLMQTALPADAGDWTAENLNLGMNEPMHITGLRISAVARDQELERGVLSPPPDKNTLYWQHNGAEAK